jgi:hypothetical protein
MTIFILGTLLILALLAFATWRTAELLPEIPPHLNLLLLPAENLLRFGLIAICFGLALVSGLSLAKFGWRWDNFARDSGL